MAERHFRRCKDCEALVEISREVCCSVCGTRVAVEPERSHWYPVPLAFCECGQPAEEGQETCRECSASV